MDSIDIVKKMPLIHCARGPERCRKCKEMSEEGEKYSLIRAYLKAGNIARPMTEIIVESKKIFCEYDVLKVFRDDKEAKIYTEKNNIEIIFP